MYYIVLLLAIQDCAVVRFLINFSINKSSQLKLFSGKIIKRLKHVYIVIVYFDTQKRIPSGSKYFCLASPVKCKCKFSSIETHKHEEKNIIVTSLLCKLVRVFARAMHLNYFTAQYQIRSTMSLVCC